MKNEFPCLYFALKYAILQLLLTTEEWEDFSKLIHLQITISKFFVFLE